MEIKKKFMQENAGYNEKNSYKVKNGAGKELLKKFAMFSNPSWEGQKTFTVEKTGGGEGLRVLFISDFPDSQKNETNEHHYENH